MFQLTHLIALAEVQRTGSVTAAAHALNFTPSALSQQLSRLEAQTGAPVLERVGRGVRLTPEGLVLVRHAQEIQARLELARTEVAAVRGEVAGVLRVASFQTLLLDVVPRTVQALAGEHPALRVDLVHREVLPAIEGLLAHDFDLIVGEEFPGAPAAVIEGTHREDFLLDPLRLAVAREEAPALDGARLAELAGHRWVLDPARSPMGQWARSHCRAAGFEPVPGFEVTDPLLQVQLARTGLSPAFLPGLVGAEHLQGVSLLELPGRPHRRLYSLARTASVEAPAVLAFRRAMNAEAERSTPPAAVGAVRA
ncbi:MAG: LysR family transcriptional regulator [Arthrobacter sp.]|jgi:DNA-binding transcriptional LysR family regulator|nr:LysR family transcriptional regulator [Arthrobacter sp.]